MSLENKEWGKVVSVSYIKSGFWDGNGQEHIAPGTGLAPGCTENIFIPKSDKMTAKYSAENDEWIEVVNKSLVDFFDTSGNKYRLNAPDAEFPEWAIFDALPTVDAEKETVQFKNGAWVIHEILLGKKYWDSKANEHLITNFNFTLPEDCTFTPPPHIKENQSLVLDSKEWVIKPDFRGTEYWDENGTKHTITEVGEEVPEGALLEAPILPPTLEEQTLLAKSQCTKRINLHWNQIGQINASLGVYGELDTANCSAWISSNRTALIALLTREDLLEIDVTDDQYWPVFEDSSE